MTKINNFKYAEQLSKVLFSLTAKLNFYIDVSKLNKGIIQYRFSTRKNTERKVKKLLREKKELEEKINNLLYGDKSYYIMTNPRNRKKNVIKLVKVEKANEKKAMWF